MTATLGDIRTRGTVAERSSDEELCRAYSGQKVLCPTTGFHFRPVCA
ncbi:hypothetical protein [Microbaculum sp. FT89]